MSFRNFLLEADAPLCQLFRSRGIADFAAAEDWMRRLPYGRNSRRDDPAIALKEGFGTCSTKHAALKVLADENGHPELGLVMGMYLMNAENSPRVAPVLERYGLSGIPEAHTYLRIGAERHDCTFPASSALRFVPFLLEEISIDTSQVGAFKVAYHQQFLQDWMQRQPGFPLSFPELWAAREACIAALSEAGGTARS